MGSGTRGKGGGAGAHTKAGCSLCVRTLRKKWTQAEVPAPAAGETPRSRVSRKSTILHYINVVPKTGPLVSGPNQLSLLPPL